MGSPKPPILANHLIVASCFNNEAHLAHAMAILNRGQEALGTCRRAEDLFLGEERLETPPNAKLVLENTS